MTRRFAVVLLGVGLLSAVVAFQGRAQVKLLPAGPATPAPAPGTQEKPGEPEFTDAITLPTDRKALSSINLAQDLISNDQNWIEAVEILHALLDAKDDVFIQVRRKEKGRGETLHWTGPVCAARPTASSAPCRPRGCASTS
jgi:hypothetical protein